MLLSVYVDESADETKERVFAVAGVIGSEHEWALAERAWVERTCGEVFHAADYEYERKFDVYRDLTQVLANSYLAGVAVALDLVSHRELFPNIPADGVYYKCLTDVIDLLATMARQWNSRVASDPSRHEDHVQLEFTFDRRRQSENTVRTLYAAYINQPEWVNDPLLGRTILFDSRRNPRIQMADLLAREAMKDLERLVTKRGRESRRSKRALDQAQKFKFVQHDRAYCERWYARMDQLRTAPGLNEQGYLQWLATTGRVQSGRPHDNWANRFQYLAWLDRRTEQ